MNRYLLTMILGIGIAAVGQATIHNISIVGFDFSPPEEAILSIVSLFILSAFL